MAGLRTNSRILLAALSGGTYGGNPNPGPADAVRINDDLAIVPIEAELVERNQLAGFGGMTNSSLLANVLRKITFSCELTTSGTPGTPPAHGIFLRACGMAETIVAGVSVTYTPIDDIATMEDIALCPYIDGVKFQMLGSRGQVSISGSRNGNGLIGNFTFMGRYSPVTEDWPVSPTFGNHADPLAFESGNTDQASILGFAACIESFNLDKGNNLVPRNLANCSHTVEITNRKVSGTVDIELPKPTAFDLYTEIKNRTEGLITLRQLDASGGYTIVNVNHAVLNPTGEPTDVDGFQHVGVEYEGINPTANTDYSLVFT